MEEKLYVHECGRYTTCDTWKKIETLKLDRIYYVNSGWARMFFNNEEHILKEGYLYFFSRFETFEIVEHSNFDHSYYEFKYTHPFSAGSFMEIYARDNELYHLFEFANQIIIGPQSVRDFNAKAITKFLETALVHIDAHYTLPLIRNNYVLKSLEIMEKDYATTSVNEIAEILNINKDHFIRLFKKETGVTPMKHLQAYRLTLGKEMLKNGKSVVETSAKCGYSSPASFYYAYKQKFGYPPSDTSKL